MGITSKLRRVERPLTKDLAETTTSFRGLGRKYGVSRQAISNFWRENGIIRPVREHTPEMCPICQGLIEIAKEPHSDFISSQTIKVKLRIGSKKWRRHIRILRENRLISQKFGRLHSKRAELAYQIYFKERLPVINVGRRVGLKNFHSVIRGTRRSGWDIPDPLFAYNGNNRRQTNLRRGKRDRKEMAKKTPKLTMSNIFSPN